MPARSRAGGKLCCVHISCGWCSTQFAEIAVESTLRDGRAQTAGQPETTTRQDGVRGEDCKGPGPSPVCSFMAGNTEEGLCDMAGNVYEWVMDVWHPDYNGASDDGSPRCLTEACDDPEALRVRRGGRWSTGASFLRVGYRRYSHPGNHATYHGFRLVRPVPELD